MSAVSKSASDGTVSYNFADLVHFSPAWFTGKILPWLGLTIPSAITTTPARL
jgi:hypothetical protein